MNRVRGLDAIRFVCAFWVVMYHVGLPPFLGHIGHGNHGLHYLLDMVYEGIFNGPAAVIVFFVISGFCIHYPQRSGRRPYLPSYYTKRLTRIGLPLAVGILVAIHWPALVDMQKVLWSLVAEIIYYLVYPLLLPLAIKYGWRTVIAVAFVVAYAVVATKPGAWIYASYGNGLNWLLGLPCWLMGCLLAQEADGLPVNNSRNIWLFRGVVVLAYFCADLLACHLHFVGISVGYPWTLNLFSIVVFIWLRQEIILYRQHQPPQWLERTGAWSYSLYLMHMPIIIDFTGLVADRHISSILGSLLTIPVVLAAAYLFYISVERPSHLFAVWLSKRFKAPIPLSPPPLPAVSPIGDV